jgi:myo-inositol 2-dehydrogenase/D-chiro-inositol 1-dehydrogenase
LAKENLRVAAVGLGKMGKIHINNCFYIDDVRVVAAADQSKKALKKAESLGIRHLYNDYHEMIADRSLDLDAVIVCLPNFLHLDAIRSAVEAGLDVFVEKPMATTVDECKEIVGLVRKNERKLMIGHSTRFIEAVEKLKDTLNKGYLGNLETLTMEEVINGPFAHGFVPAPVPEWWLDVEKVGGGVLLDLGYHLVDLFRFLTGSECRVLFSCLDHKFHLPVEDGAVAILQAESSSTKGIVNVGWYQQSLFPQFNFRAIAHGSATYLSTDDLVPRNMYRYAVREGVKNILRRAFGRRITPLSYTYYGTAYYKELQQFFESITKDHEPPVTCEDGLKTIEAVEEAYKNSVKTYG